MNFSKTAVFALFLLIFSVNSLFAQTIKLPEPRQEKLLNGMKLLVWNDPSAEKATVKLRINFGAAFDPKDKMGTMALLADILFPTEQAKEFFSEDLEGSLNVESNYDYIQLTATGKADEIQAMLETFANAVTNPQITKENFELVRNARAEKVKELEKNPSYIADRAAAHRLYGDFFPYGRSIEGTSESLKKIEIADLLQAEDRYFTADNAALAVIGKVNPDFVYRATRRLFGSWKKSESKIPATFRLPDAPDTKEFAIELPEVDQSALRFAMDVAARNDKDFFATRILTRILQKQFCLNSENNNVKAAYQPYLLRGFYIISQNVVSSKEPAPFSSTNCPSVILIDGKFAYPKLTQNDFAAEKNALLLEYQQKNTSDVADLWLDVDTYKLSSVKEELSRLNGVNFGDIQRVADKLQKEPVVSIVVRKPASAQQ